MLLVGPLLPVALVATWPGTILELYIICWANPTATLSLSCIVDTILGL